MKIFTFLTISISMVATQSPNTCKTFTDYVTMNPSRCWFNPEVDMDVFEILKYRGYPYEIHEVETEDHYLLTVVRLPRKENPKGVIFLQHPAISSCIGWVDKGPKHSFGFMLYDAGYDVWMGNSRGCVYSRKHKFLNPDQQPYWNFSFHEMGVYDIPAELDLVANVTNVKQKEILFIGYSMGATLAVVHATLRPDQAEKLLKLYILWAPSTYVNYMEDTLTAISQSADNLMELAPRVNMVEFLTHSPFISFMLNICKGPLMLICLPLNMHYSGTSLNEFSPEFYSLKFGHNPAGVSAKSMIHYAQMIRDHGRFQMYNYGSKKNLECYKTEIPPLYPVENISVPIYLIHGDVDVQVNVKDVEYFWSIMPEKFKYRKDMIKDFSHESFFYGTNVREKVYLPQLRFINKLYE